MIANARRHLAAATLAVALVSAVALPAHATPQPHATPQHDRSPVLRAQLEVCLCADDVTARFLVERYVPERHRWDGAAGVPVVVEERIPGNTSPQGWRPDELLSDQAWSDVRTGDDGSGEVRLDSHANTMQYRLRLPDGGTSSVVRPDCSPG